MEPVRLRFWHPAAGCPTLRGFRRVGTTTASAGQALSALARLRVLYPFAFFANAKGWVALHSLVSSCLLDCLELGDLYGALGEAGGDFQFSTHGFDEILQGAHVHVRAPLQL